MTITTDQISEMLNAKASAEYLGYHKEHVRRLIREGKLKGIRFGERQYAVSLTELDRFRSTRREYAR